MVCPSLSWLWNAHKLKHQILSQDMEAFYACSWAVPSFETPVLLVRGDQTFSSSRKAGGWCNTLSTTSLYHSSTTRRGPASSHLIFYFFTGDIILGMLLFLWQIYCQIESARNLKTTIWNFFKTFFSYSAGWWCLLMLAVHSKHTAESGDWLYFPPKIG